MNPDRYIVEEQFPPLTGTLGKAELEFAAAVILLACKRRGSWGPVTPKEAGEAWQSIKDWRTNPFFRIDPPGLVAKGFAVWVGAESDGNKRSLELTEECLRRIAERGYVKAGEAAAENCCEHGDHAAPDGKRFCSKACERCEHESKSENGCDGICGGKGEP